MHRDEVRIAEPCGQDWGAMQGDARRRHCAACDRHVHDLSAMSERAARRLLRRSPDVCVRYTCRTDGTVVHTERRLGRTLLPRALAVVGAALAATPALAAPAVATEQTTWELVRARLTEWFAPAPPPEEVRMGELAPMPPPPVIPEVEAPRSPPVMMGKPARLPPPAPPAPTK